MSIFTCHSLSYLNNRFKKLTPNPSFIILGHSMGGVISLYLPFLKVCENITISEIITLSSPLKVVPFSYSYYGIHIENIYQYYYNYIYNNNNETNLFYKQISYPYYSYKILSKISPLLKLNEIIPKIENMTFLSLVSDFTDTNIYPKNSEISSFIPLNHGITIYLSNIKELNHYPLITDHYSILWCHESSVFIGEYLYELINKRSNKIYSTVKTRMNITLEKFKSGLISENIVNKNTHISGYNPIEFNKLSKYFQYLYISFTFHIDILPSTFIFILFLILNYESCHCINNKYILPIRWYSDIFSYYKKYFTLILMIIILSYIFRGNNYLIESHHLLFLISFGYISLYLFDIIINISHLILNYPIVFIAFFIPILSILISYFHISMNMKYVKIVYDWNGLVFYSYLLILIFDVYIIIIIIK